MPDTKILNFARGIWRGYLLEPMAVATGLCIIYLMIDTDDGEKA